jgi:DNA-binding SARP family transcriptional activator
VDAVWGDEAPLTAAKIVHNSVSQLRKLLEPDGSRAYEVLVRHRTGYELRLEPDRLDSTRFERLVQEGTRAMAARDAVAASARLREALDLWRGPALADFAGAPFAEPQRARLDALRLAAIEDRVEADLALNRAGDLVAELEALVSEHPLRERLRGQLMLALYRTGRQADALSVYQSTRRLLVDELGIDPSPALQRLQRAILRHDPELERAPDVEVPRTREVRKTVSAVVAELTATGPPLDPELLHERISTTLAEVASRLERHGAQVEPGIGGVILAVFGTPTVREDDPVRAVRAALDARDAATESGFEFRAGIAAGNVLADESSPRRRGPAGPAIDSALRLHRRARPGEILVEDATRSLLGDAVRVRRVKGAAWLLEDVVSTSARDVREGEPPFVARDDELGALGEAFEQSVRKRAPYLFTILGPAGIGKSRVASRFTSSLGRRATVLHGRCLSYGEGVALGPIAGMVEQLCGGDVARLAKLLAHERSGRTIAARAVAATRPDASTTPADTLLAVRQLFESLARSRPLVLVVDDLQWAEPTLLDLIENVVERSAVAPILVVCLARPELLESRPAWGGGKLNATSLLLGPLSDRESHALMKHLVGGTAIPAETRERAAAVAEGNPLFLEQMLAVLVEQGPSADLALPPTIHALLAARLDRLDLDEREVLEHASVIGKEFSHEPLVELVPAELRGGVDTHLDALQRRGLIRACDDGFEFHHLLLREVAYQSVPKRVRARLHERLATWLEHSGAAREHELDEVLGHHYERAHAHHVELRLDEAHSADLAARAAERLATAGRRAHGRDDAPAAVALLARAAALDRSADVLVDYGDALRDTGGLERAATVLAEAAASADSASDLAHVEIARLRLRLQTDPRIDVEAVSCEANRAIAIFEELEDDGRLAKAWELLAWVPWFKCRAAETDVALQKAVAYARRAGDRRTEAQSLHLSIGAAYLGPMPIPDAVHRCEELLKLPEANPRVRAAALRAQAGLAAWAGDDRRARALVRRHRSLVRDLGLRVSAAAAAETYGVVELAAGDPVVAEAEFRRGIESLDEMGDRTMSALLAALLAHALVLQGRADEALRCSERSRDAAAADDLVAQVQWRTAAAKALVRTGKAEEAESLARDALALARTTDFSAIRAETAVTLAEVLRLDGRSAAATAYVEEAVAEYERKGCRVHAARARAVLEEPVPVS